MSPTTGAITTPGWRSFVRRGGVVLVAGIVLGVVVGLLAYAAAAKQYTGIAKVQVADTGVTTSSSGSSSGGRTTTTINMDNEAQFAVSGSVLGPAWSANADLRAFGGADENKAIKKIASSVTITVPANTTVLSIGFTAASPTVAANGANAIAEQYLKARQAAALSAVSGQIKQVRGYIGNLNDSLLRLYQDRANAQKAGKADRVSLDNAKIAQDNNRINLYNAQLVTLHGLQAQLQPLSSAGLISNQAQPPSKPSSPSKLIDLASGFALGLLLGLVLAWWRVKVRRRVDSEDDLTHVVDAPCVADLRTADPRAVGAISTYRHLSLVTMSVVDEPARIVVTSPLLTSAASHVASGIAGSLARSGTATALLQVHGDEVDAPGPIAAVPVTRYLDADDIVEPADRSLPNALERVRGDRGVLVIDVPGSTITPDAQVLAADADAVIVVVPAGSSSADVKATIAGLDSVGAPILGTVLVREADAPAPSGRPGGRQPLPGRTGPAPKAATVIRPRALPLNGHSNGHRPAGSDTPAGDEDASTSRS